MTPKTDLVPSVAASLPAMSQEQMVDTIKQTVAKNATDAELQMFLAVCRRFDLDPFAKEVFFIKDKDKPDEPGRVQTGRDGFLAIANRHPAFEGMTSDVVFLGDTFKRTEVGVDHQYDFATRKGAIVGAYALVYRSDRRFPSYAFARKSEYEPANVRAWSPWAKFPSAMILKVAETAALKKAFSISGLTPIGISEPDDDYIDTPPPAAERPQIPFAQAVGRATDPASTAPRPPVHPEEETPSSTLGGEPDYLTAEDLETAGQTSLGDDQVTPG